MELLHRLLAGQGETQEDLRVLQQGEPLYKFYAVVVNKHPRRADDMDKPWPPRRRSQIIVDTHIAY